jgi:hypothetical protein
VSNFALDIANFARKARINIDVAHRKICLDLLSSLIKKSPVDTGRFRGNWQVGYMRINGATDSPDDKNGGAAIGRGLSVLSSISVGGVVYLTNSLPYAIRLEYGWSKQAPNGMVRLTLIEHQSNLRALLAGLN